jgi:hypothetical protein
VRGHQSGTLVMLAAACSIFLAVRGRCALLLLRELQRHVEIAVKRITKI